MATSTNMLLGIAVIAIVLSAGAMAVTLTPKTPAIQATDRTIYITAVEYKGSTSNTSLSPPTANFTEAGAAYGYKKPGVFDFTKPDRWEVSAYSWNPQTIIVYQGDKVTLKFFGVNGDKHRVTLEPYITTEFTLERGRFVTQTLTADKAGEFVLICENHKPHMTATFIVLPRS